MTIFRQGDVLVRQVPRRKSTGKDVRDHGRVILAYGEVTGHAHELVADAPATRTGPVPAQFFEEPDGRRYLFVERACVLIHQEHGAIALAPGCYEVVQQREYSPEEVRNVAD